jgi:hypothetical protein
MKISGTFILAYSKLRVRRLRTAITIAVSGILFGVTIMLLVIVHSGLESTERFNNSLFDGNYFAFASNFDDQTSLLTNVTIQAKAKQIYQQTIDTKTTEANSMGIAFDVKDEVSPITYDVVGDTKTPLLDLTSPSAQKAVADYKSTHPDTAQSNLTEAANAYNATHLFQVNELHAVNGISALMHNGEESFGSAAPADDFMTRTFPRVIDESVVKPFLTTTVGSDDKEIPLLVPASMAERLLGLSKLPESVDSTQKLDRINDLKTKTAGLVFSVCYRNDVSKEQIESAMSVSSGSSEAITYGLPNAKDCAQATVLKDSRSVALKASDDRRQEFNAKFGEATLPVQRKVSFKVVGLLPDDKTSVSGAESITEVVQSFLFGSSQLGTPIVPLQAYQKTQAMKIYGDIYKVSPDILAGSQLAQSGYLVEFANKADMRRFIEERNCTDQQAKCQDPRKPFPLVEFGTTSVKSADIAKTVESIAGPVLIGVVFISALIMAGTFGRIIIDSRREIAIYRAVGASRRNIAVIFMLYSFILSLLVAIFTLVIGVAGAFVFDAALSQQATVTGYTTYGLVNEAFKIHFVTMNIFFVWWIPVTAIATGIVSMLIALPDAMNRTVVEDVRDE